VHAARVVLKEQAKVQEEVRRAGAIRARAEQQAAQHAAVQRALSAEAQQEREASIEARERARAEHEAEQAAMGARLAELEALLSRLLADTTRVQLRAGAVCTLGELVRSVQRKAEREQRGRSA
jgi:hypothetical protein